MNTITNAVGQASPTELFHSIESKQSGLSVEKVILLYFNQFDRAIDRGCGFYFLCDRLSSTDAELQTTVDALEATFQLGESILKFWQNRRGKNATVADMVRPGNQVFDSVVSDLLEGKADKLFDCGSAFNGIEIGPGLLTLIGAPPGRGKTALAMQCVYDAVANENELNAIVASLEVTAETLVKRKLSSLLGTDFDNIRFNRLTQYQREQLKEQAAFRDVLSRVGFLKSSHCGLGDLETLARDVRPGLFLMDYVQLFGAEASTAADRGMQTMATAMRLCEAGWGVVAVSALNRSSYEKSGLNSFRDTSSIEYSGTSAYLLEELKEYEDENLIPQIRPMRLKCAKNRNGRPRSLDLMFNGGQMLFSSAEESEPERFSEFDEFETPWEVST